MTPPIIDQIKARMQEMYGVEAIGKWYDMNNELAFGDDKMLLASMLSDVQEMIERGMKEEARQTLNRAKWLIREHL
jgi:hypothetical protein